MFAFERSQVILVEVLLDTYLNVCGIFLFGDHKDSANTGPTTGGFTVLGIFHPRTISNAKLHKETQSKPLQVDIT